MTKIKAKAKKIIKIKAKNKVKIEDVRIEYTCLI
jgi:hypothetical protein